MRHLIEDSNIRIRLIAASVLAIDHPEDAKIATILVEASADPTARLRQAVIELIDSLGSGGCMYWNILKERLKVEREPGLQLSLTDVIERMEERYLTAPGSAKSQADRSPALVA
jgi:hypothetical protein